MKHQKSSKTPIFSSRTVLKPDSLILGATIREWNAASRDSMAETLVQLKKRLMGTRLDAEGAEINDMTIILSLASLVLGSKCAADEWMETPAIGLNQKRPVDVLKTNPELVVTLLARMEYGTYT